MEVDRQRNIHYTKDPIGEQCGGARWAEACRVGVVGGVEFGRYEGGMVRERECDRW